MLFHYLLGLMVPGVLALQCRYDIQLTAYPINFAPGPSECSGTNCIYLNLTSGQDTAKKFWKGWGYGCDAPDRPMCSALGAVNQCVVLSGQTLSLFGLSTVTIRYKNDGVVCCCNGNDFCDPAIGQVPKNLKGASDTTSGLGNVTGPSVFERPLFLPLTSTPTTYSFVPTLSQSTALPSSQSTAGRRLDSRTSLQTTTSSYAITSSTTAKLSAKPAPTVTGQSQVVGSGTCELCQCDCNAPVVNGTMRKFNIGIFLGVYICVVAAAVVITPSYMLARCLPPD